MDGQEEWRGRGILSLMYKEQYPEGKQIPQRSIKFVRAEDEHEADEHTERESVNWRFDRSEAQMKIDQLRDAPVPSLLRWFSLFQWKAGESRQCLELGLLACGSF